MLATLEGAGHGDRVKRDIAELAAKYPVSGWAAVSARLTAPPAEETAETSDEADAA
jgi:hypothetical protein